MKFDKIRVKELGHFITVDYDCQIVKKDIDENMLRKWKENKFNLRLATKAYKRLADFGAKKYVERHKFGDKWNAIFSIFDRREIAVEHAYNRFRELEKG